MTGSQHSLAGVTLFAELDAPERRRIELRCKWRSFAAGEQVFDKDSDSLEVYFIVDGSVHILSQAGDREVALADVGQGRYFGELAALDGLPRSARVAALSDCLLASLSGPDFRAVLSDHPALMVKLMSRMTAVIRDLDRRVVELSTTSEVERICAELLRLARPAPDKPGQLCVADVPNHKEIASWIGSSREAVAQVIGELARDGVVKRRGMGLMIIDPVRLRLLARAA